MKKFWKYLTILILLLLGLCCVGVLYLFFVPNSSLFNITYISHNQKYTSNNYNQASVDEVKIISNKYPVKIYASTNENLTLSVYNHSFGFVLTENSKLSVVPKYEDRVLTFNIKEPFGASLDNNSFIELRIPTTSIDLTLQNNLSLTTINSKDIKIDNLTYTTNSGDLNVENCSISGNLKLNLNNATAKLFNDVATSNNNLTLDVNTGKFIASKKSFNTVKINSNTRGVIQIQDCKSLTQFSKLSGGRIEANKVNDIEIETSDTHVNIKEILESASIVLTKFGSINIDKIAEKAYVNLETADGSININNTNTSLLAKSRNGDITINNATYKIEVESTYGNVSINFKEDAPSFRSSPSLFPRTVIATEMVNGKLSITGVDKTTIKVKKNCRLDITYHDICGQNKLEGQNGSVFVKIDKDLKYKLTTSSAKGNVRVNLAQIPDYNGYTYTKIKDTYVNTTKANYESTNNTDELIVSTTNGDLTILDSYFY